MKLYSGPVSMFGAKAQIALAEKGLAFELEMVPFQLWGATRYDPVHPEVARINPKKQVPVLVDGETELFDSTLIFEYLEDLRPDPALWPAAPGDRAAARLLEMKSDEVFFPNFPRLLGLLRNPDEDELAKTSADIQAYYAAMEAQLSGREYLAGDVSYADIAFYMAQYYVAFVGHPMPAKLVALNAWRKRMSERAAVRGVIEPLEVYLKANGAPAPVYEAA